MLRVRTLLAYEHTNTNIDPIIGAQDATQALRQQQLLQEANQTDNTAIAKLSALNADARQQQLELQRQQSQQQQITDQLAAKTRTLNATLNDAQTAATQLQAQLDQEIRSQPQPKGRASKPSKPNSRPADPQAAARPARSS